MLRPLAPFPNVQIPLVEPLRLFVLASHFPENSEVIQDGGYVEIIRAQQRLSYPQALLIPFLGLRVFAALRIEIGQMAKDISYVEVSRTQDGLSYPQAPLVPLLYPPYICHVHAYSALFVRAYLRLL
jgi:hypothetical protein